MPVPNKIFFKPRIGEHYAEGFNGYRTLVVGVHLMCEEEDCIYKELCQSPLFVAGMDDKCPCYENHRQGPLADYYRLSNCNAIELDTYIYNDGKSPSFSAFTKYLLKEPGYVSPERKKELWDSIAFCNYLQCFRPDSNTPSYRDNQQLYDNCLPAFKAMLRELNPQRLYVWSDELCECLTNRRIKGLDYYGVTDMQVKRVHVFYYNVIPGSKAIDEELTEYIRCKSKVELTPDAIYLINHCTKRAIGKGFLRFDGDKMVIEKTIPVSFMCSAMMNETKLPWMLFNDIYCHKNLRGGHYDHVSPADESIIRKWIRQAVR